jgi:hypothetical protein
VAEDRVVRVVFASRHGELRRTTEILRAISAGEPVLPTAFALSVLNATSGVFGIARGDRSPACAVSAGAETLGYALLEAHAQYATQPSSPVLVVYADEPADAAYGTIEDEVQGGALAILLDAGAATGHLKCTMSRAGTPTGTQVLPHGNAPTQSQAVLRCLDAQAPAAWEGAATTWRWSWYDGAA